MLVTDHWQLQPVARRGRYAARAAIAFARDPYEGAERVRERFAQRRDDRQTPHSYEPDSDWERSLHGLLEATWPCSSHAEFDAVWSRAMARLRGAGLLTGRGAYGGWDDADPALGRALWCVLMHAPARVVVETGVARGLTTRVALEALERRGGGTLWSIDVPPLMAPDLASQTGAAVPTELRARWRLVVGSSRRRLAAVLARVGTVDAFVHDSMHTSRNIRFELETVWPALRSGGVALVDDIGRNGALATFVATTPKARVILAPTDDGSGLFGILHKGGEVRERPCASSARRSLEDERAGVGAPHDTDPDPRDHSARPAGS